MDNKTNNLRIKLTAAVFILVFGGIFLLTLIMTPPEILQSERRIPTKFPPLSFETVASAEFMEKFDNYAADSFPCRDSFRTLSSILAFRVFRQTDKSGLYLDSNGAGMFKPIEAESVEQLLKKIRTIAGNLNGISVYYSFIPDKSVYSDKKPPGFDTALLRQILTESPGMEEYTFIDITDELGAGSYYRTDLHWKQTKLAGVLDVLGASMGFDADLSLYSEGYAGELEGVYAGQIALPIGTDSVYYLYNPYLSATYLNEKTMAPEPGPVYNWEKLTGLDAYDFFLSGAQPLVILENDSAASDRELYLFRDSFSSSLAPLLASFYSRIVLIDLRYIDIRTVNRFIEFKPGSDALFLYSTLVINNPDVLLISIYDKLI